MRYALLYSNNLLVFYVSSHWTWCTIKTGINLLSFDVNDYTEGFWDSNWIKT